MATIVSDTFTGISGADINTRAPDVGATPVKHSSFSTGNVQGTSAGRCTKTSTDAALYYYPTAPATAEYTVTMTINQQSAVASMGPAGRIATGANTCYFARFNASGNLWEIFKTVAGASTSLGSSSATLTTGVDYTCALEITDAAKNLRVNGSLLLTSNDNAVTAAGYGGLRSSGLAMADTTGIQGDNLTVVDSSGGGGGGTTRKNRLALMGVGG